MTDADSSTAAKKLLKIYFFLYFIFYTPLQTVETVKNGLKWLKMVENGWKWLKTVDNRRKRLETVGNSWR